MTFGPTLTPLDFGAGVAFPASFSAWSFRKTWTPPTFTGTQRVFIRLADDANIVANANRDGSDIRIVKADGETLVPYELLGKEPYVNVSSMWTWFCWPQAVSDGTKAYVAFLTREGFIGVAEYTQATGAYVRSLLRTSPFEADDHSVPSLRVRDDGKIQAFYGKHSIIDSGTFSRISTNVGDISSWDAEFELAVPSAGDKTTYTQVHDLGSNVWLIRRVFKNGAVTGDRQWQYSTNGSDGDSGSWSAWQDFYDGNPNRGYIVSSNRGGGNRIDFAVTAGYPGNGDKKMAHMYTDGTNWYATDGSVLSSGTASLPLTYANIVADASSDIFDDATDTIWQDDVIYGSDDKPHILATVYPADSSSNQDLYLFSWNGTSWDSTKIVDKGSGFSSNSAYYSGAARFGANEKTIYLNVERSGILEIEKWVDSGSGHVLDTTITSRSRVDNWHPQPVVGTAIADFECVWIGGGANFGTLGDYIGDVACMVHPGPRWWSCAYAKVDPEDTPLYIYYGNSDAIDRQDGAAVWNTDYDLVVHAWTRYTRVDQLNTPVGGTFTLDTAGEDSAGLGVHDLLPALEADAYGQNKANGSGFVGSLFDLSGQTKVFAQAWVNWSAWDTNEVVVLSNWDNAGTTSGMILRLEPSDDSSEFLVRTEVNTSENISSTAVGGAVQNEWHMIYSHFDGSATELAAQIDKTENTAVSTNSAMDANASTNAMEVFSGAYSASDKFRGLCSEIRLGTGSVIGKTQRDLEYDMINNSSWATFGGLERRSGTTATDFLTNLLSHWKLNEASGNRADSHGASTLTENGTVGSATGKVGDAAEFDASTVNFLSIAADDFEIADTKWSLVAWTKIDDLSADRPICTAWSARQWICDYDQSETAFRFLVRNAGDTANTTVLDADIIAPDTATWYMIHAWHDPDSNVIGIQVNAGKRYTTAHSGGVNAANSTMQVGMRNASTAHDGLIDSLSIWQGRLLGDHEIMALYNSGAGLDYESF